MKYLFFLGQNIPLSLAELDSLVPNFDHKLFESTALFESQDELDLDDLNCRLGGTVKIASFVSDLDSDNPTSQISDFIQKVGNKNFSINILQSNNTKAFQIAKEVKEILTKNDFSSRYIKARNPFLSPLIIKTQSVTEITIDLESKQFFHTTHLHDYNNWIERDRNKPFLTPKQGMLPPKLARIMVNLGLNSTDTQDLTLLDPFCGTGTILTEAVLLGANTIGSDISEDKMTGTRQNLDWLPQNHFCQQPFTTTILYNHDATHLSKIIKDSIDVIVTEPSLGPVSPQEDDMPQIAEGLQKLYLGALKDWQSFLKDQARLVIAFPRFKMEDKTISTHEFIDSHPSLSYNIIDSSLIFTRPGAKIERQILILKFNKK